MEKFILSLLVKNEAGVLTRVSGMFERRAFNIDSLSVGETIDPKMSRITVAAMGDEYTQDQIVKQLNKLHDVITVQNMDKQKTVVRELLLVKVDASRGERSEIMQAVSIFRAKIVDLTPTSLTVEITGESSKCDAFIEYLKPFKIAEICRTGITAIERGSEILK